MKKLVKILLISAICSFPLCAFDYNVNGSVSNTSKFGFNNGKINTTEGKYPTDSFSVVLASLGINLDLGAGFSAGLAGAVGGIVFDNTRFQKTTTGDPYVSAGLAWNYFGYWAGPDYRSEASARTVKDYVIYNGFIAYKYDKYIEAKIGRFSIPGDWFNGIIQGAQLQSWAIPYTRLWAATTNKRASYGGKWLKDFKYINQNIAVDNGRGFYVYAGGADINYKNFNIQPYLYAQDSRFIAPGFHLGYDSNPDFKSEGFRSKTEVIFLYMRYVGPALTKTTIYNNFDQLIEPDPKKLVLGKQGESLMIRQRFDIDNYNFGFIIYKNFGNPNEFLTPYGDPTGFDNYENSVYDSGAWNNMFRREAISGLLFAGGNYTRLSWGMLTRFTHSPRADEQTFSVSLNYKFPLNIAAGITLEYYNNTTFKGYSLGYGSAVYGTSVKMLEKTISQDRSFASTYISYSF
ncbi:outer membrane family protein [Helicobacter sp. 11S03491-1]|uniref:outer membrane family protein n=1 Tax=Helicobacter sp. 11S03491-1 TaxID=1476196 RepID=UPI000BA568BC|nr:outer membrane family protein [Helicobacter sp. 11S03491-1]PAF42546.1 hypothetical protein BKH45_03270 [Helicobacter sp. 11S03491-1]